MSHTYSVIDSSELHMHACFTRSRWLRAPCGGCCRILGCQHCNVKASGNLLPSLALLDQLQELHLDRNWFNGTLPPAFAYGFPALTSLRLDFNSLTVGHAHHARLAICEPHLPHLCVKSDLQCRIASAVPKFGSNILIFAWTVICIAALHLLCPHLVPILSVTCSDLLGALMTLAWHPRRSVTCVAYLQGVIPPDWGQPGAFPSLQHLNIGGNQLKGLLPEIGVGAMSKLQVGTCTLPHSLHYFGNADIQFHTTDCLR